MIIGFAALSLAALMSSEPATHHAASTKAPRVRRAVERVMVNDNRKPAGTLRDGVLTLQLDARLAEWHPDGESAPGVVVPAFAEVGGPARIPGPLVRVMAGAVVQLSVHNSLAQALTLRGLQDRSSARGGDTLIVIEPGGTRSVRMRLDTPGNYYYYGSTAGQDVTWRAGMDAQLSGAIIVDAPGTRSLKPDHDRVFMLGVWSDTAGRALMARKRILVVVNGRSWPNTERLDYAVGDTVVWHVLNASADAHPMHLHGFYYLVDHKGDGVMDSTFSASQRRQVNTEAMNPGSTMSLTWVPERPGNWLFHCHLPDHFSARAGLGMARPPMTPDEMRAHASMNHATSGMNGLVIGVTVHGKAINVSRATKEQPRDIRLVIRPSVGGTTSQPLYRFALDAGGPAPVDSGLHLGPSLVVTRGQPVRITVVNTLDAQSSVHWHGIELDSYYDGVAGFSGDAGRLAPVIAPHDSFVAKFTPPRSGTFIYHTHVDETVQQLAGLAGPLIVMEPGRTLDTTVDHPIMITTPLTMDIERRSLLLNGSAAPAPLLLRAGVVNRLRFINMTLRNPQIRVDLVRDSSLAMWTPVAKDGADLPAESRVERRAASPITIGETRDFELTPPANVVMRLVVHAPNGAILATMPVRSTSAP